MTPSGIEPATLRLVPQFLNQLRHRGIQSFEKLDWNTAASTELILKFELCCDWSPSSSSSPESSSQSSLSHHHYHQQQIKESDHVTWSLLLKICSDPLNKSRNYPRFIETDGSLPRSQELLQNSYMFRHPGAIIRKPFSEKECRALTTQHSTLHTLQQHEIPTKNDIDICKHDP